MQLRRQFIKHIGLTGLAALSYKVQAQESLPGISLSPKQGESLTVVMLANFKCGNSGQANFQVDRVRESCLKAKIGFRFAPVSPEAHSPWPDRIYYTVRDFYPAAETLVRNALFDGMQNKGLPFESMSQVLAYFMNSSIDAEAIKLDPAFDLAKIASVCSGDEIEFIRSKAARLGALCERTILPVFLWIKNGEIAKELSPEDHPSIPTLINTVVKTILQPT